MMAPQSRLLWLFGTTILPATLAVAVYPALNLVLWLVGSGVLALCIYDAVSIPLRRHSIAVELPEQISLTRKQETPLTLQVRPLDGLVGSIQLALELPVGIVSTQRVLSIALSPSESGVLVEWPITGLTRGEYRSIPCHYRTSSRLGLWAVRKRLDAATNLRVYPDLENHSRSSDLLLHSLNREGRQAQRQLGQGREFEKVREYVSGDSMSDVHWKQTARRGRLVTKEFQIERAHDIYIVIDASRLSSASIEPGGGKDECAGEIVLETYISAAMTLGTVAVRQGDRFGLVSFSNEVIDFVRARAGPPHFRMCRDALMRLQPHAAVNPDFEELAGFLVQHVRRRSLLLFLTSLDDPALAESFERSMGPVGHRHLVLVAMVNRHGSRPLFSSAEATGVEDIYRSLAEHITWQDLRQLEVVLRRRGIGFSAVSREDLGPRMISRYLSVKQRQAL